MTDPALEWLYRQYQNASTGHRSLWLCDEAAREFTEQLPQRAGTLFVSNRWDVATRLEQAQHEVTFNDFNLDKIASDSLDTFYYRLSKEKPVVHHIINAAARTLKPGGELIIAGLKNEGAKTILDKAAKRLGCAKATQKNGLAYGARLSKGQLSAPLDDSDYQRLRPIATLNEGTGNELPLWSKPGQFGWQKTDAGSAFLIDTVTSQAMPTGQPLTVLDLGCGYGYLSVCAAHSFLHGHTAHYTLTDNNAAALYSARYNCEQLGLSADVVASDAGQEINDRFDLILCNPPFHQGFSVSDDLTERFIASAGAHLNNNGQAFFVVNAFIGIEQKAKAYFSECQELANNRQFKVLKFTGPKR
ncbi:methyltransferase [Gilvimarinus agarilyticus]|uniref:methyltransferase n=1 Tax=Gilvimarinus agarilyticus TaxID=679259 RepID=UPI0005A19055|nr:methyltransferase [Gilvimarinus agarilyticus]